MRLYQTSKRLAAVLTLWCFFMLLTPAVILAQEAKNPENTADKNLKSAARINPSTLAMEFTMPFGAYPGRNGSAVTVAFNYSSKIWQMAQFSTRSIDGAVYSYHNPIFAEKTAAGWSSSVQPPRLKSSIGIYDSSGSKYSPHYQSRMVFPDQPIEYNTSTGLGYDCDIEITRDAQGHYVSSRALYCIPSDALRNYSMGSSYQQNFEQDKRFIVKRFYITMPDGGSVEFRKDDNIYELCDSQNPAPAGCLTNLNATTAGTYLATDGSRMRLEIGETQPGAQLKHVLYLPNGSRYLFPAANSAALAAEQFVDADGNQLTYQAETSTNTLTVTDTMGRQIQDPLPGNWFTQAQTVGTKTLSLKGLNDQPLDYQLSWNQLKSVDCAASATPGCGASVLEDDAQALKYSGASGCEDGVPTVLSDPLFENDPDVSTSLVCGKIIGGAAARFNPVVLSEISLPDGAKYKFKYDVYGEITRIDYPTGGYERFRYDKIPALGYDHAPIFEQTNRGVVERWVSSDGTTIDQHWTYSATGSTNYATAPYVVKTTAPDGSRTERYLNDISSTEFGFSNILSGMPYDEKSYDAAGGLRSRKLTDWTVKSTPVLLTSAQRDPRPISQISIVFENNQALATMSETEYETPGENNSAAPTDPGYFAHLNVKQVRSYHYLSLNLATAATGTIDTIKNAFHTSGQLAAISQTDYQYSAAYKGRGFPSLPVETRSLNPANPTDVLAKSRLIYDEPGQYYSLDTTDTANVGYVAPTGTSADLRGNVTTAQTWVRETGGWLSSHAQYDTFGNLRKAWDISGDPNKFVETQYSSVYNYAYPTKVIAPAPAVGNVDFGSTEDSTSETTYDPTTGLPLTVKNDAGQITRTEYDAYLRPWRTYAANYAAPETQMIYGAPDPVTGQFAAGQRFVKVRKQIDATNWDEATTWTDGLGRTIKTQAKDSSGDVFTETQYDGMGRAVMTTNPYRAGETKLWNLTEFDSLGRAYRSRAPVAAQNPASPTGDVLGTSAFDISTVAGFVGTVNISTDASGRKSRSITNALGQLLRVDEATATGGTPDADLGPLAAPTQPTFYTYDPYGKMVKVQQGGQSRYFKYDSFGRLLRVRQPEQQTNASLSLTDAYNTAGEWTAGFTYDLFGNVRTATDARNVTVTDTYDRANRVLTKTYSGEPGGQQTPTVYFTYDGKYYGAQGQPYTATGRAKGSLTQVRNGISTAQTIEYDALGRAKKYQQITDGVTYTSEYTYNEISGALVEEKYPDGRVVQNEFNSNGDLARVFGRANAAASEKTYANSLSYTAAGGISRMRLGNGRWETAQFNNRLQMTELGLGSSATDASLWKVAFDYGELSADGTTVNQTQNTGNIARQTISFAGLAQPFVQTYRYDSLYRLKEAREINQGAGQANWAQNFAYDRFGNRTGFARNISGAASADTPAIDPLTNRFTDTQTYGYDKNGNLVHDTAGQARNFTFNGENKQIEVRDPNIGVSASNPDANLIGRYSYDGEGKRVKKETTTETTIFVYSGGKLIQEYSTKPADQPSTNYTTSDHLGTPRIITDELGRVKARRDFLPFGEELPAGVGGRTADAGQKYSATKDEVRQKFTGYQKDAETQLDYAEARYYNNAHGRFTAVDPLLASGKSADPQTFNRYVYCSNNPVNCVDPTGMEGGGVWGYRDWSANGGREYRHFKTQEELDAWNKSGEGTDFCRDNVACTPYQTWTGGNFVLWANRTGAKLGDDGSLVRFSLEGHGTDEQWTELTRAWYAGEGLSAAWQKAFSVAFDERNPGFLNQPGVAETLESIGEGSMATAPISVEASMLLNARQAVIEARAANVLNVAAQTLADEGMAVKKQKIGVGLDARRGILYFGRSGSPQPTNITPFMQRGIDFLNSTGGSRESWAITNCAEFGVCNGAISRGTRSKDFYFTVVDKQGIPSSRCYNCQFTTNFGTSFNGNKP